MRMVWVNRPTDTPTRVGIGSIRRRWVAFRSWVASRRARPNIGGDGPGGGLGYISLGERATPPLFENAPSFGARGILRNSLPPPWSGFHIRLLRTHALPLTLCSGCVPPYHKSSGPSGKILIAGVIPTMKCVWIPLPPVRDSPRQYPEPRGHPRTQ